MGKNYLLLFCFFMLGTQAFGVPEVELVGPGGKVMIYYKDPNTNEIVVRTCTGDYPDIKKRSDCTTDGQENRVPVASFKRVLLSEWQIVTTSSYRDEEFKSSSGASDSDRRKQLAQTKKEWEAKKVAIQKFVDNPLIGCDQKCDADRKGAQAAIDSINKELAKVQKGAATYEASLQKLNTVIQKMNESIDKLVDEKIASSKLEIVSSTNDKANYELLQGFDGSRPECGTDQILNGNPSTPASAQSRGVALETKKTTGSRMPASVSVDISARMKDCHNLPNSEKTYTNTQTGQKVVWKLVSRKRNSSTGRYYEVWQDSHPNKKGEMLLIGDNLDFQTGQSGAAGECAGDHGKRAGAEISERKWELPSIDDFEQLKKDGVLKMVPDMEYHWYWSSSVPREHPNYHDGAWGFDGKVFGVDIDDTRANPGSVRCISR